MKSSLWVTAAVGFLPFGTSCGEQRSAEAMSVGVETSRLEEPFTTNLGFSIELSKASFVMADFFFQQPLGASANFSPLPSFMLGTAWAHPGHGDEGTVTGELLGRHEIDFAGAVRTLGQANLLTGTYDAFSFGFGRDEELRSVRLIGTARKDTFSRDFDIALTYPEDRRLKGAEFQAQIDSDGASTIRLSLIPEGHDASIFDDVDFSTDALSEDDLRLVQRRLGIHDYYGASIR